MVIIELAFKVKHVFFLMVNVILFACIIVIITELNGYKM